MTALSVAAQINDEFDGPVGWKRANIALQAQAKRGDRPMSGRRLCGHFRGRSRDVLYWVDPHDPDAVLWHFADFPYYEPMTGAERADIEAMCLAEFQERRSAWRARLLTRPLAPELRHRTA